MSYNDGMTISQPVSSSNICIDSVPPGALVYAGEEYNDRSVPLGRTPLLVDVENRHSFTFTICMHMDEYIEQIRNVQGLETLALQLQRPTPRYRDSYRDWFDFSCDQQHTTYSPRDILVATAATIRIDRDEFVEGCNMRRCVLFIPIGVPVARFYPLMPPPGTYPALDPAIWIDSLATDWGKTEAEAHAVLGSLTRCGKYEDVVVGGRGKVRGMHREIEIQMPGTYIRQSVIERYVDINPVSVPGLTGSTGYQPGPSPAMQFDMSFTNGIAGTTPAGSLPEKLRIGLERLEKAKYEPDMLGPAILSVHGALEDHFRSMLANHISVPDEARSRAQDAKAMQWRELCDLMQSYVGLSESDARYIMKMNSLRISAGHGGTFEGTYEQVERYACFVRRQVEMNSGSGNAEAAPGVYSSAPTSFPGRAMQAVPYGAGQPVGRGRAAYGMRNQELPSPKEMAEKRISIALCAIFLGAFGVHKFMMGCRRTGKRTLILSVCCPPFLLVFYFIGIVEGLIYLSASDEAFYQTYILNKRDWF